MRLTRIKTKISKYALRSAPKVVAELCTKSSNKDGQAKSVQAAMVVEGVPGL